MDLNLTGTDAKISADNYKKISIEIEGIEESDVLDHFEVKDFVDHLNEDDFLEHIGIEAAKKYWGLTEIE